MTTPIADMVAEMLARGIAVDVIVLAVRTAEQASRNSGGIPVDETAERRRAYDRERKRKNRNSGGIPVETPRNSNPPLTLTSEIEEPKREKKVRARKAPAAELPPDWQPNQSHREAARTLGFRLVEFEMKADDMRIWAKANGARKVDWDATFHGFLRRDAPKLKNSPPRPESRPRDFASLLGQRLTDQANEQPHESFDLDLTANPEPRPI